MDTRKSAASPSKQQTAALQYKAKTAGSTNLNLIDTGHVDFSYRSRPLAPVCEGALLVVTMPARAWKAQTVVNCYYTALDLAWK